MENIPLKNKKLAFYRIFTKSLEKNLPRIPIKANTVTAIMLILSVLMPIFIFSYPLNIALLSIILILDFLDGAAARQQKSEQRQGYLIDTTSDKISDFLCVIGLIAFPIGKIFLVLVIINILLQFYALKSNKHYILAIRFFLLLYLIAQYLVII